MAYIGNVPAEKYSALTQQTFSSPTGTSFTLSTAVTNSRDIALFIDNVRQDPTSYTAVGTALTTSTIASPSTMYCLFIGKTVETISPPAGSVDATHLVSGSVGTTHLVAGSVDSSQLAAGSVDLSHLSATGTPSASLALKGDFTWGSAGGPSLGSGNELLRTNSNQINQNVTIPSGTNASSVGPISVGASYSVAVNGVWAII
jgi:hypothetical protein